MPSVSRRSGAAFAMSARRSLLLATSIALGLVTFLLVWPTGKGVGGLSVRFVGQTNDVAGKPFAQFRVANHFSRRVRFGVDETQFYQTNGWPDWGRDSGRAWVAVAAGRECVFSVPVPPMEGATKWRVPLTYQVDLSFINEVRFRIDGLLYAIPRWRPGGPPVIRICSRFHRILHMDGPEMPGVSNLSVQPTEASHSAGQTNPLTCSGWFPPLISPLIHPRSSSAHP